jgi:nicotinamide-nucleotide amidase
MTAYLLTVGDEILIGQITDTNSAWMAQQLNAQGIQIVGKLSVGDVTQDIITAIELAFANADLVLMTGGLGATKDDITKKCIASYFGVDMVWHQETFDRLNNFFQKMGREPNAMNKSGCFMPANALIINNERGLAPAMWFEKPITEGVRKVLVSMPGVPFEMMHLLADKVLPKLREEFPMSPIAHRTLQTAGEGETMLAEKLAIFEENLPENVKLAYLPSLGTVRLRLTARGKEEALLQAQLKILGDEMKNLVGSAVFGEGDISLAQAVGNLLLEKKWTLATAESCTGGNVAHFITLVSGSSAYFAGGVVTYSNELKMKLLGVSFDTLEKDGAVSEATVREMVRGTVERLGVNVAVAISGVAGPTGGTLEKPTGTVWLAVGNAENIKTFNYVLDRGRDKNIDFASMIALNLVRKFLLSA